MKINIFLFFIVSANIVYSQTAEERKKIVESYDKVTVERGRKEISIWDKERKERVENYFATKRSATERMYEKDGVFYEAVDVKPDGQLLYYRTFNEGSSKLIKANSLHTGGALNLSVNGENMEVGVWDQGVAWNTHLEFPNNKVTSFDGTTTSSTFRHATHVTGTLAGVGVSPELTINNKTYPAGYSKGIAPAASVWASNWTDDISEMEDFAATGKLASNHSYGYDASKISLWQFGAYDAYSYFMDKIAHTFEKYQIVFAAGNDRAKYAQYNPNKGGYDLITGHGNAKNVLTVAAVADLGNSNIKIADFSNFGPTDDGRIKPNISAKGVNVFSANSGTNNGYYVESGTSMAAPAITGSILLLQQHYNNLNSNYMNSATVRGLLQHTAQDAGVLGPDYSYGWGLANIEAAAVAISNKNNGSVIEENELVQGTVYTKKVEALSTEPLIVSISWTDIYPLSVNTGQVDSEVVYLINDLDLRVTDEKGTVYYPWKLDGKNPTTPAVKGDNVVDNFERVDIPNPSGIYTITVSHKGNLIKEYDTTNPSKYLPIYGGQEYSLVVTGPDVKTLNTDEVKIQTAETKIYPVPASNAVTVWVEQAAKYSLYEMTGKLLSTGNLSEGENTLSVSHLAPGAYIIKMERGSKIETKKIIVK